ncbi:PAS domain-containing protein [Methylobacterium sp. WL103]|uniref:PAS domain-containing protein n=1 Tax=Methylobacterium sp. WL103 TaxID=2603891 RepID=UPI0011C94FE2|nr:PAS domain-containing protein [Methylobacterium sp. WL103]TXM93632.1 PAS domain-containing protein [Methylobacterium sp. WL103]
MKFDGIDDRGQAVGDLHAALQASGVVGTWDWNPVSQRVRYDPGAAELLAGDAALAGRDLEFADAVAGIHPDDVPWMTQEVERAMQAGGLMLAEYRAGMLSGQTRWLLCRGRIFHDPRGRPVRSTGILIDITEVRTMDAGYVATPSIGEPEAPLVRAADLCIALHGVVGESGSEALRGMTERLLLQIGREIARAERAAVPPTALH